MAVLKAGGGGLDYRDVVRKCHVVQHLGSTVKEGLGYNNLYLFSQFAQ